MSEYQYYEWIAVDRPLTEEELEEVSGLSSHMDIATATQAVVTYSYGDFKHDRRAVLLKYFDAMLYAANWGSRELAFRFPVAAIDAKAIQAFCIEDRISLTREGKFQVLEIDLSEEDGGGGIEAAGILRRLVPLREQIIQGDYRALYMAWLAERGADEDEDEDDEEGEEKTTQPPVPAGLRKLTAAHKAFMQFFDIDSYLVKAAAESSAALQPISDQTLAGALSLLPRQECDAFLLRVLQGETQVGSTLRKRLIELAGIEKPAASRRTPAPSELAETAKRFVQEEQRRVQAEAERKRIQELEELAKRVEPTWTWVEKLIEQKQSKPYDEAVALLVNLRALAVYQKRLPEFESRLIPLVNRYTSRRALIERLRNAGLAQ